jgi:hypothetical protein
VTPAVLRACGRAPVRALFSDTWRERFHGDAWVGPLRTGSSGLGDAAAFIPAGGGPVREVMGASRTVQFRAPRAPLSALVPCCGAAWAVTELAKYRRLPTAPEMSQLSVSGGALRHARPLP